MIRRRLVFNKVSLTPVDWRFYLALTVGILLTILFYYFITGIREVFRHPMSFEYPLFVPLSPLRTYLYNFFFAFLSSTVGVIAFTKMWASANLAIPGSIRSSIAVDQQMVPGYFIYLFLKLGFMFCFLLFGSSIFMHIDIARELWPLFVIGPIFIFLHQWLTIRLRIKQASLRVMMTAALMQLVFVSILAAVPFHDFSKLDAISIEHSPHLVLKLDVPASRTRGVAGHHWASINMHLGYRRDNNELAMSAGPFDSKFVNLDGELMKEYEAKVMDVESNSSLDTEINLHADRNVPAKKILDVVNFMRRSGNVNFRLVTNDLYERNGFILRAPGFLRRDK